MLCSNFSCVSCLFNICFVVVETGFLPGGLQESSKVVWCSEKGDFTGTVKWTGKIKESYFAGVEFVRQKTTNNKRFNHAVFCILCMHFIFKYVDVLLIFFYVLFFGLHFTSCHV